MSSSLFNSPLRKQTDQQKAEDSNLQKNDSINMPEAIRPKQVSADENTNQIKNPLQHIWDEAKNCFWHAPKAVEGAVCLAVTAVISLISVVVYCKNGSAVAEKFKNDYLEIVVENVRSFCNKNIYCGSLFDHQKSFLKQNDGELKDNLNPFKWLGESLMSALMYAVDWSRSSFTRFTSNLVRGKNLSAEEFREYEYQNTGLRLIKNTFDLAKGLLSLFVIRKINPGKSLKELIRPLGVATGMSAASAVGEKWQEGKSALTIDTAEQILAGSSNSLAFMGLMQGVSSGYVNRAANFQEKISRSLRAQNFTEFYDLRDSIPDLVNALHKARHDLWDKDTGRPRDKWAILGHLLSTGAAATDAAELKASGLNKLPTDKKNINKLLSDINENASLQLPDPKAALVLPNANKTEKSFSGTKVKQYSISDLKINYINCRKKFLLDQHADSLTENEAEKLATEEAKSVVAYFDPFEKVIVVAKSEDLKDRKINPAILQAIFVVHESVHLSLSNQGLSAREEEFKAWLTCLKYARAHEIDISFKDGFISYSNIKERSDQERSNFVIEKIKTNQAEVRIPLRKEWEIKDYINANYDLRYKSLAIREEREFALLNSARIGVNQCKEILEILKSDVVDSSSQQKVKSLLLSIAEIGQRTAEAELDNELFSKDKEELSNLVAELFIQRDRNFWDGTYQSFTASEQLKIHNLAKLGFIITIKKSLKYGAKESNLELLVSNVSFFSEALVYYLQVFFTEILPTEFKEGCSEGDFKLFEELLSVLASFLKHNPAAFPLTVRTQISQDMLEILFNFDGDTIVSLESLLQFNTLIKIIPYTQYEKDIIRTKQVLKHIDAGNSSLARMLAQQYQVPRERIFEILTIQICTVSNAQLTKHLAQVESAFGINDDDLELIVDVAIKQVAISYDRLEMAEYQLLNILKALNVEEEAAIEELNQIYFNAYGRSVERLWTNLKEAIKLNDENKVIEAKLKLIDLFNLAIEDLISTNEIRYYLEFKKATGDYFPGINAYKTLSEEEKVILAEIISAELNGRLGKLFNLFLLKNYNGDDDVITLHWDNGLEILEDLIQLGTGQEIIKQQVADYLSIACEIYLHAATVEDDEFNGFATSIQAELARILRISPQLIDQVLQENNEATEKIAYTFSQMILSKYTTQERIETFLRAVFLLPTEEDDLDSKVIESFDGETLIVEASFSALNTILSATEEEIDFETKAHKFNLLFKLLNTGQICLLTESYWETYNDDRSIKFDPVYFMELSNYLQESQLELSAENLMVLLKAYSQFALYEPLLFEYFEKEIVRLWGQLSIDQLISVLYCFQIFAVVREDNSALLRILDQCESDNKKQIQKTILNDHLDRIKLIYSAYRIAGRELPKEFSRLENLLKEEVPPSMSSLELDIHQEFLTCGINIISTRYVEGLQPDFILQIAGRKIIIEADATQFHYINSNPKEGTFGYDRVRDKIYTDAGYEVIRINNEEHNANSENFLQYFAGRLGYNSLADFLEDYQRSNESVSQDLEQDVVLSEEQRRLEYDLGNHPLIRKFDRYLSGSIRINNISSIYEQGSNPDLQQVVSDISAVFTEEADQLNKIIAELEDQHLCIVRSRHKKSQLINSAFVLVRDEKQGYLRSYVPVLLVPEGNSRDYWRNLAFQLVLLHCRNYFESENPCPLAIKHQGENTLDLVNFVLTTLRLTYPHLNFELRELEERDADNQAFKVYEIVPTLSDSNPAIGREERNNILIDQKENLARLSFQAVAKRYENTRREQKNINERIIFCSTMAIFWKSDPSSKAYGYAKQALEDLPAVAETLKVKVLNNLISYLTNQKNQAPEKVLELLQSIFNGIIQVDDKGRKAGLLVSYTQTLTNLGTATLDLNSIYEMVLTEARSLESHSNKAAVLLNCLAMFVSLKIRAEGNQLLHLLKESYEAAKKDERPSTCLNLIYNCFIWLPKIQEIAASAELVEFCRKDLIRDISRAKRKNKIEASLLLLAYIERVCPMNIQGIPWIALIKRGIASLNIRKSEEAELVKKYFELIPKLGEEKLGKGIEELYRGLLNNDLYFNYQGTLGTLINIADLAGGEILAENMKKSFNRFDRGIYPQIEVPFLNQYIKLLANQTIPKEKLYTLHKKVLVEIARHSLKDKDVSACMDNFLASIKQRRNDFSKTELHFLCKLTLVVITQLYKKHSWTDMISSFLETFKFLAANGFKDEVAPIFPEILAAINVGGPPHKSDLIKKYLKIVCKFKVGGTSEELVELFGDGLASTSFLPTREENIDAFHGYIDLISDNNSFSGIEGLQLSFCREVIEAIKRERVSDRMPLLAHLAVFVKINAETIAGIDSAEIKNSIQEIAKEVCSKLPDEIEVATSYIEILMKLDLFTEENKAVTLCAEVLNKIRKLNDREKIKNALGEYISLIQGLGVEVVGENLTLVCKNVEEFVLSMEDSKEKAELLIEYVNLIHELKTEYPKDDFINLCKSTLEVIVNFPKDDSVVLLGPDNQERINLLSAFIGKLSIIKVNNQLLLDAVNALFAEITKYQGTERIVETHPEVLIAYFRVLSKLDPEILAKVLKQQAARLIVFLIIKQEGDATSLKCFFDLILQLPLNSINTILTRHYNAILSHIRKLDDGRKFSAISDFRGFVKEFNSKMSESYGLELTLTCLKDSLELIDSLNEDGKVRQLVEFLNGITEIKENHPSNVELVELYNKGLKKLLLLDHLNDFSDTNIRVQLATGAKFKFYNDQLKELIQSRNPKIIKEIGLVCPQFAESFISEIKTLRLSINQRIKTELIGVREHTEIKAIRSRIIIEETAKFLNLSNEQVRESDLDLIEQMLTFGILESREEIFSERSEVLTQLRIKQKGKRTFDPLYRNLSYRDAVGIRGQRYEEVAQLCDAVGRSEQEAINALTTQISKEGDRDNLERLKSEKNYRDRTVLRYLEILIDSSNQKSISYILEWTFNENFSAKRREYLIRKLFDVGYWDQQLGQYLLDNHRDKSSKHQQYQKEYHYRIIKALCQIGISPELSVFKLLESSNPALKAESLEERIKELARKKKEYEGKTRLQLIELLKTPEDAVIYYACFGGQYTYRLIKNYEWTKLHGVMEKAAEIEANLENLKVFIDVLKTGLGIKKSKEVIKVAFSGRVPLLNRETNEFDLKITEDNIGFTAEDLDKQCEDIWSGQLVKVISSLVYGIREEHIHQLREINREMLRAHHRPDLNFAEVESLLDEISKIKSLKDQEQFLEDFRKSQADLASTPRNELISKYITNRAFKVLGAEIILDPLFSEWRDHLDNLMEQNAQLKTEVKNLKKNQTFRVRFIDKVKDLIAAIRFKDGMQSCINSSHATVDNAELGNDYYTVMSQMYADAFSFMLDIKTDDSPDVIGSVGIRMGIDPATNKPVVMLQGIYCENRGPAFVNSLLELIETQFARPLKASKIVLASQYGGTLFYTPLGYKKLQDKEFVEINAISSIADTSCYDDLGTVRNGLFKFRNGFVKELEYAENQDSILPTEGLIDRYERIMTPEYLSEGLVEDSRISTKRFIPGLLSDEVKKQDADVTLENAGMTYGDTQITRVLVNHKEIVPIIRHWKTNNPTKGLLILNIDTHDDCYTFHEFTNDANWAYRMNNSGMASVYHIHPDINLRGENTATDKVTAPASLKNLPEDAFINLAEFDEIWITVDYDYFSSYKGDPALGFTGGYNLDENARGRELQAIVQFLRDKNIKIKKVVPVISPKHLYEMSEKEKDEFITALTNQIHFYYGQQKSEGDN